MSQSGAGITTIKDYSYTDFTAAYKDIADVGDSMDRGEFTISADGVVEDGLTESENAAQDGFPDEDTGGESMSNIDPEALERELENRSRELAHTEDKVRQVLAEAEEQAASIIKEAMDTAERVKKDAFVEAGAAASEAQQTGYNEGFERGHQEGYAQALETATRELEEKNHSLLEEISRAIAELDRQKTDYIRMYNEEMKDLVIAIAEKVINVSLKSSGEIIRRMILNAVENGRNKEWAKIYISEYDANIMVHEDSDILDALRQVSDNIKIEVMENGEPGDLLVEYPNQVIDAGVATQIKNIKQIMDDTE